MLGLGEFNTAFDGSDYANLFWFYFIVATGLIMLLFLNMVIGIMGRTFSEVTDNLDKSALITRTEMYADFSILLNFESFDFPFFYVITPTGNDCESEINTAF